MRGRRKAIAARRVGLAQLDGVWVAIRRRHAEAPDWPWTVRSVAAEAEADEQVARDFVLALERGGFVTAVSRVAARKRPYLLIRDPGVVRPRLTRDGKPQPRWQKTEAIWRALWILKAGSVEELLAACAEAPEPVTRKDVGTALSWWAKGGFVEVEREHPERARSVIVRFRGVERPGPQAPEWGRTGSLYEPNEGAIAYQGVPRG